MSVQVSAAVMRKIMGKAPKLAVGDRVAGCFSGLCGTITRVYCDCARAKMDDGRSIVQAKRSWVKVNMKTTATAANWKRIVGQRVRQLSPEDARIAIARIAEAGATIHQPEVRALTGGINSQSINAYVVRRLAVRAGIIK